MSDFKLHTASSAPERSRPILQGVEKSFGFAPNLFRIMAESPAALQAYTSLSGIFEKSSLSPTEQQIVLLSTSFENGCSYCMAAHTAVAGMQKVPGDVVEVLREDRAIDDPKLEALRTFTRKVVQERGLIGEDAVQKFLEAGYTKANLLEVLVGVTQKTLSNYVNHITCTPLDTAFEKMAWSKPGAMAGI